MQCVITELHSDWEQNIDQYVWEHEANLSDNDASELDALKKTNGGLLSVIIKRTKVYHNRSYPIFSRWTMFFR